MAYFKGKVAIVTGGASGIGRALCEELGARGATVIVADINAEGAQQVASAIATADGRARSVHLDVSQAEKVQKLVDETVSEDGRLDYMFNNAGIAIGGEVRDMNLEHWRRIMDVNLWGVIHGTTAAYRVMLGQGFGHIVNTASAAGLIPVPMETAYAATKHAVVGLSTSLRGEAAGLGVKVSVVCPGFVRTGIYDAVTILNADRQKVLAGIPFRKMDAAKAARVILRGAHCNRAIITFPLHARALWWLFRLCPGMLALLAGRMVGDFRALRAEPGPEDGPSCKWG